MFLISKENHKFIVFEEVVNISTLLKESICDSEEKEIKLSMVSSRELGKIIEFMVYYSVNHMKPIVKPIRSTVMKEITEEWYANFIDIPSSEIFELTLASNFMDIQPLLDLCCAKIASIMKEKTPDEIRDIFDIQVPLTNENIEKHRWCS
jgi:S-phase kinase-associated protein 1